MNFFGKLLLFLQNEMETPKSFGWFHLMWITLVIIAIIILYKRKDNYNEKQLKKVLGIYGIVAFILELLKQIIWTFNYNPALGSITMDYSWYSFPFQLCTTPIYVSLICLFLKDTKIRKSLLSYMAFTTILGSIATILMPDSCFTSDILVNIHTMWLHMGSFVVSIYLLITNEVKLNLRNLRNALIIFLIFVGIAQALNIGVYNSGILNGETFNMFYISPYFISHLPIFDVIQQNVAYPLYFLFYISVIAVGTTLIFYSAKLIKYLTKIK